MERLMMRTIGEANYIQDFSQTANMILNWRLRGWIFSKTMKTSSTQFLQKVFPPQMKLLKVLNLLINSWESASSKLFPCLTILTLLKF